MTTQLTLLTGLVEFLVVIPQVANSLDKLLLLTAALVVHIVVDKQAFQLSHCQRVDFVARRNVGKSDALHSIHRRSLHTVACVVARRRHFVRGVAVRFSGVQLNLTIATRIHKKFGQICNAKRSDGLFCSY